MRTPVSTVSRYVLHRTASWMGICMVGAVAIFVVTQFFRTAPIFIGGGIASAAAVMGLLTIPVFAYAMAPACLIAVFATAGKMQADDELLALDALCISRGRAVSSLGLFLLVAAALNGVLWIFAVPAALAPARDIALDAARIAALGRIRVGQFNHPAPGLTFYAEKRDELHSFRRTFAEWQTPGRRMTVVAEKATFDLSRDDILAMQFSNGRAFILGGMGGEGEPVYLTPKGSPSRLSSAFKQMDLKIPVADLVPQTVDFLPASLACPTAVLAGPPIPGMAISVQRFALWRRIAGPIGFLTLSFFGVVGAFFTAWKNRAWAVSVGVGVFAVFHLTARFAESMMQEGYIPANAAALLPAALPSALTAGLLFARTLKMQRRSNCISAASTGAYRP